MTYFSSIPEVCEASFSERVLQSEMPALVAVCADGTGASRNLLNLLLEWTPQTQGRLTIFRFNAEGSSKLPGDLSLPPAPSLVLFSQGAICYQFVGEVSRGELDEMLARARVLGLAREPEAPGDRRPAVGPPRLENVTP